MSMCRMVKKQNRKEREKEEINRASRSKNIRRRKSLCEYQYGTTRERKRKIDDVDLLADDAAFNVLPSRRRGKFVLFQQ